MTAVMGSRDVSHFRRAVAYVLLSTVGFALVAIWSLAGPDSDVVGTSARKAGLWLEQNVAAFEAGVAIDAEQWRADALRVPDGDPARGKQLIADYGCGACHVVPGVSVAKGTVGPDLGGFARQAYIAGILPNRPGDLMGWLEVPPRYDPQTVMPDMGVTETDAAHMAAYLYTLGAL